MMNPPGLVKLCLDSIYLILTGQDPTDWRNTKAFISKDSFIKTLIEFKSENIKFEFNLKNLLFYQFIYNKTS
jgi:hypothetical protein